MKTGDILLVHSQSWLAKIIQKFQMKKDPEAGYWNHSGIIFVDSSGVYVVEAAEIEGYKVKSAVVITPLHEYTNSERELLLLSANKEPSERFKRIMFKYVGIPYDYKNLVWDQVWRLLKGVWRGRDKEKAWKRMVCHEYVQKVWNEYNGIFPEWNKAMVSEEYHSKDFTHKEIVR